MKNFKLLLLAVLMGFSYKKMSGRFAETKKMGRNNEVSVRWGSTVPICRT